MADYSPVSANGVSPFSRTVGGTAVVGGTLVSVSADNAVVPCTTGDHPIGMAAHDAAAAARVTIWPLSGVVHEVRPQGTVAIAAGVPVIAGTTGYANTGTLATVAAAGTLIGICVKGGTGGTSLCQFIGT